MTTYHPPLRVLMLSKACLVSAYRTKLEAIARFPNLNLAVMVPPVWQDPAGAVPFEPGHTAGYTLWVDPIRFNGRFHLHYYPTLPARLRQFRPHIVHLDEEPYNLATWLGLRQAQAIGAKTLFFSWQNLIRRYPPPFRQMERHVLRHADYAIMGNQAAVQVWRAKGYPGPLAVIPQFGVDPDHFHPAANPLQRQRLVIGSASRRLVPEKGLDLLLRAAAQLPGDWEVQLAGAGPLQQELGDLARQLGIQERVHFVGPLHSETMPYFLRQIDILVLPSRTRPNWKEQFGRVLVEAMACAVPVIGSNSGEIPHVIGDAGLIFPEDNLAALVSNLTLLVQSATRRQTLGAAGRQRVLEQYTQAQIAARTVAVYHHLQTLPQRA